MNELAFFVLFVFDDGPTFLFIFDNIMVLFFVVAFVCRDILAFVRIIHPNLVPISIYLPGLDTVLLITHVADGFSVFFLHYFVNVLTFFFLVCLVNRLAYVLLYLLIYNLLDGSVGVGAPER